MSDPNEEEATVPFEETAAAEELSAETEDVRLEAENQPDAEDQPEAESQPEAKNQPDAENQPEAGAEPTVEDPNPNEEQPTETIEDAQNPDAELESDAEDEAEAPATEDADQDEARRESGEGDVPAEEPVAENGENQAENPAEEPAVVEPQPSTIESTADEVADAPEQLQEPRDVAADGSALETPSVPEAESSAQVVQSEPTVVEAEEEELLHKIPENFYYDYHELVCRPKMSENSEIPESLLTLHHSFGYDCNRRSNLYLLDDDHLLLSAGSLVVILSIKLRKHSYLRTIGAGSVGAITVHPTRKYFVVAEKGFKPDICIYEYPSVKLYRILREGTEESYSFVTFDPTGEMLASLGGKPDYMLTIWNWKHEHITLRCKAFSQEIFRVSFSNDLEGILTTAGQGHIRFWKMARTFTGLKLQGEIGRFGKTELSDIEGYVELPDGKVLSGCESGNMLLWDGGLIKVEIGRKGKRPCHHKAIQQFIMDEGELLTVGLDGYIRVWDFESIDQAEAPDEGAVFEIEPMNELLVKEENGHGAMLKWMIKALGEDSLWYAQDANGGIWKLDLSFSHTTKAPEQMFSFHAGAITGVSVSPVTDLMCTVGRDRSMRVYDYVTKHQLTVRKFHAAVTCIKWLPISVDPKGSTVIAGFGDGVLRMMKVSKKELDLSRKSLMGSATLTLMQVLKPHNGDINALEFSQDYSYLASGSEDGTIFFFTMNEEMQLSPIGYVVVPCPVRQLQFAPHLEERRLLIIGDDGKVADLIAPEASSVDTTKTFLISNIEVRQFRFKSIKDHLQREERRLIREAEKKKRREKRAKERQKKIERGLIDPDKEPAEPDSEEEPDPDEGKPLFIPETYNINTGFYSKDGYKVWLSLSGYDSGYLYECEFEDDKTEKSGEPIKYVEIPGSNEVGISFISQCGTNMYLFGMEDGKIRIQVLNDSFNADSRISFDDLGKYWVLPMHDIDQGALSAMTPSINGKFLLSGGMDGNLYVFTFLPPDELEEAMAPAKLPSPRAILDEGTAKIEDIEDPKAYSIEDAKQKAEKDRLLRLAEEKKANLRKKIQEMRRQFKKLLLKNGEITSHLQLDRTEFELDPQNKIMLSNDTLARMDLAKTEYAWDSEKQNIALRKLENQFKSKLECDSLAVQCIADDLQVSSFRCEKLPPHFVEDKLSLIKKASKIGSLIGALRAGKNTPGDADASSTDRSGEITFEDMEKQSSLVVHDALELESQSQNGSPDPNAAVTQTVEDEIAVGAPTSTKPGTDDKCGKVDQKAAKALGKMEKQRQRRLARQKQWDELMKEKPSDDYEDPRDVAEIKYALEHMGDFKLKTAANYVVPEHLRMNTARKLVQLATLQEQIYAKKRAFNERLMALKFRKMDVLKEMNELSSKLESVHLSIKDVEHIYRSPTIPVLVETEQPEAKYHFTREKLIKFRLEKAAQDKTMAMAVATAFSGLSSDNDSPRTSRFNNSVKPKKGLKQPSTHRGQMGGMGSQLMTSRTTGASTFKATSSSSRESSPSGSSNMAIDSGTASQSKPSSANMLGDGTGYKRPQVAPDTNTIPSLTLEDELLEGNEESSAAPERQETFSFIKQQRLLNEQQAILDRMNTLIRVFDDQVIQLRAEKYQLQVEMKRADLRNTTLFEEFVQLKEFEKREDMLAGKVNAKYDEKLDMQEKVAECSRKVDLKKQEIDRLEEKQKNLFEEFKNNLGDNNKWEEFLTKVFKKKIKRAKKKEKTGDEEEDDDDDEDSDSDDDSDDSDFDDEDEEGREVLDDSVCPPGCEQELYDMACQLRETRLDIEEMLAEEKKTYDLMKKDADSMVKKTKIIDHSLAAAEKDLEDFQVEKQGKLNQLQIIVVLKIHQIEYLVANVLPNDLSEALVFEKNGLLRLQNRIHELNDEKSQQSQKQKENKLQNVQLKKGRKMLGSKIEELNTECDQMMLLKFGRIVNLEKLEMVTVNRLLEELKEKYRQTEMFCDREISQWEIAIQQHKENITMLTRDNTRRIQQMTMLLGEQKNIEEALEAKQKKLGGEYEGKRKAEVRERERLIQLVQLQAQEIEALKEEITLLSRKGGHILPPAQPPMPVNQN